MGRRIEYTNDPLGQVLKKSIDGRLETAWTYDGSGNVASIERGGVTSFQYDPHNRLIYKSDPEGNTTRVHYEERPERLIKRTTDPMGIETVETYNPQGQRLQKEVAGQCVEACSYDPLFRLNKQDHLAFGYTPNGNRAWVKEGEERVTKWIYTPGGRVLSQEKPDGTLLVREYDAEMRPVKIGSREFRYDNLDRIIGGSGFSRTLDPFGNITREEWSTGLWIESDYDDWDRPIERRLPDRSRMTYKYQGPFLKTVTRIASDGKELYSHTYDRHDARGNPQLETGLFETTYQYDACGRRVSEQNPYSQETVAYDPSGHLVRKGKTTYTYDAQSQMTSESGRFTAGYDAHYNLNELNGTAIQTDPLNQIEGLSYDRNGNLLLPGFVYDPFDQLIETASGQMVYDALGRRLSQGTTSFLYLGDEEIGAFEKGAPKELKIPGATAPVAIEIEDKPYAPIVDVQGVTRLLIDRDTGEIAQQNSCDAFGSGITDAIPYAYLGKRYDPATGLVYFGQRYYMPSLHRWLTPDPLGSIDHSNLYQYVFNNPFLYQDPKGENILGFLCGIGQIVLGGVIMASGIALEVATFGGYTFALGFHEAAGLSLMTTGCALAAWNAKDISYESRPWSGPYTISKNDSGIPSSNTDQNTQANDAKREIERKLGKKLTPREERKFHDHVSGQGYGYHEMVEEGYWLLGG
jgi:RHS repeat-associated protein